MVKNKINDMKQTAVEWLVKQLNNNLDIKIHWRTEQYIKQAKEMEKEQIIDAYEKAMETDIYSTPLKVGKDYYNETFKSE